MTSKVRLIGTFFNADEVHVDVECSAYIVKIPTSSYEIGARGGVQTNSYPTVISLYDVGTDTLAKIRAEQWSRIVQPQSTEQSSRELQIRRIEIDGQNVKVFV